MEEEKCLYQTVYSTLQERIRNGKIQPGERLPAEKVLAEEFEVSRFTVQKAMRDFSCTPSAVLFRM